MFSLLSDVPVVVYTGNHGDKPSSKASWDGSRDSSTVDELLKGSGGVFGYGGNGMKLIFECFSIVLTFFLE